MTIPKSKRPMCRLSTVLGVPCRLGRMRMTSFKHATHACFLRCTNACFCVRYRSVRVHAYRIHARHAHMQAGPMHVLGMHACVPKTSTHARVHAHPCSTAWYACIHACDAWHPACVFPNAKSSRVTVRYHDSSAETFHLLVHW